MRKLVVVLLVLIALVAIVDRVAVAGVERELSKQVASRYRLDSEPKVKVRGVPFLTQAMGGKYRRIDVDLGSVRQSNFTLSKVNATLYDVRARLSDLMRRGAEADIRADRVAGTALVDYETVSRRAPRGLTASSDGKGHLVLAGELTFGGLKVPVRATMAVRARDGGIVVTPTRVQVSDSLSVPTERLTFLIPIRNLPLKLKITDVRATAAGIEITAEATDVPIRG